MAEIAGPVTVNPPAAAAPRIFASAIVRTGFMAFPLHQRFLAALVLLYVAKALIFVFIFPPFSGHDEVAHYSYIRTVVDEHRVPTLLQDQAIVDENIARQDDRSYRYQNTYIDRFPSELYKYCRYTLQWYCAPTNPAFAAEGVPVTSWGRDEDGRTRYQSDGVQYAANHPPLYYVMMAPIYWLSEQAGASIETQLYLLRLAAIPFGLAVVLLAYLTTRLIFPRDTFMLIGVPTFVALQTQISYEATMVNNDIIAIASFSWILYLVVRAIRDRFPPRTSVLIGFALGLGIVAKSTSITGAAIIGLAMLTLISFRSWSSIRESLPRFIQTGLLIAAPAVALSAPWYIHMYRTYGNFTGLPQVLDLQEQWNHPAGTFFGLLFNAQFVKDRFGELWGQFGWRVLTFDPLLMQVIAIPTLIAAGGFVLFASRSLHRTGLGDRVGRLARWQFWAIFMMLVACAVAYLATVQFGTQFDLTQARYFFPVINALAILLVLGLRSVIPVKWHPAGSTALVTALVVLNVFVVTSYVIPYYWL